jgi:hypothetical protein
MKLKNFFGQFPNPWTLRVSGMGGCTSKCEKKSKSLHPIVHSSNFKNERTNVPISFLRFGIVPKFVFLKTDVSIWSSICSPGQNLGTNSNVLVSFLLDIGTFLERLWNFFSFTVLTLLTDTVSVHVPQEFP